jgi:hypothetical protein
MQRFFLTGITSRLHNKAQPVNAVCGNNRCLLWEKYGTHRYTMWAECRDCTSQETNYVSNTKANRLMLFGEIFAVYCENLTEHTGTRCGQIIEFVPHRNSLSLHYNAQPVNDLWGNNRCLLWEPYGTPRYTVWAECGVCTSQESY